jgi:hypothetical protein
MSILRSYALSTHWTAARRRERLPFIKFGQAPIGIAISHSCYPEHADDPLVKINQVFSKSTHYKRKLILRLGQDYSSGRLGKRYE